MTILDPKLERNLFRISVVYLQSLRHLKFEWLVFDQNGFEVLRYKKTRKKVYLETFRNDSLIHDIMLIAVERI